MEKMSNDFESSIDIINNLASKELSVEVFERLIVTFRYLRNICAEGSHIQNKIVSNDQILWSTDKILSNIIHIKSQSDSAQLCLLVGLQFMGNLLVKNNEIQARVWHQCEVLLNSCLVHHNSKIQNCAAMISYNIFLGHPELMSFNKSFIETLIYMANNGQEAPEFVLYVLQLYVEKSQYIELIFNTVKQDAILIIMGVIQDLVKNYAEIPKVGVINFFLEKFSNYCDNVQDILPKTQTTFEGQVVIKILELFTSISSDFESSLVFLQSKQLLLINCINLLKSIHSLSKEPCNVFSMIKNLSELDNLDNNRTVQKHPYFDFKSLMIRLIGNLCWKNTDNQNKVRELDAIPVLLDCCNIDGRNPFIIQWTILAIRNICENNIENQKYIAALPAKGEIDVENLQKMGILLNEESDGSTMYISPLKLK